MTARSSARTSLGLATATRFALAAVAPLFVAASPAMAQSQPAPATFDIAAGPLSTTLTRIAEQSGVVLSFEPSLVAGRNAPAISGAMTAQQAMQRALEGSGLELVTGSNGTYRLQRVATVEQTMRTVKVVDDAAEERLPPAYAGGQVARGGRLGMLGNIDVMDAPFNITSYTSELIENQQARTVGAVLANDPSVRDAATSSAPGQYLLIRGFVSQEAAIFFNGLAGMAPNNRSSTEMAERVELLKGPSAAINGMVPDGSVGGTVAMAPKRAADEPLTRVSVDHGSRSQLGGRLDIGRRFGEDKAWGIRVNGVLRDGESNVEGRDQRTGLASVALDYRGERLRAALDMYDQNDKRDGTDYYVNFSGRPSAVPDASEPMTLGDTAKVRDRMAMARIELDLTPQVTAFAAFGRHSYRSEWVYANNWSMDSSGNGTVFFGSYRLHADLNSGEAGLRASVHTGPVSHRLTLAATDFKRTSYYGALSGDDGRDTNLFDPTPVTDPGDPGSPPRTDLNRLESVALTDTLGMMDERFLLTLGLRHQGVETESIYDSAPYDESAISPLVAAIFKLSSSVSLYANSIQGLSQGPVAPVDTTPPLDNAGEVFPPYKSKQYELGVKGEWSGFGSSLSLFQIARPNSLTVGNRFTVDGEQRNRGVEWNVFGALGKRVRVLGGVTLIDAEITKADGATEGKDAYGVPGVQANLGGEWDVPGVRGLTLSGRAIYTDSVYIDSANLYSVPSWTRWDVGARYAMQIAGKPLVLRANIDNLFDESYWMGYRQGWRSGMVSRGAPRTLQLSVTTDF